MKDAEPKTTRRCFVCQRLAVGHTACVAAAGSNLCLLSDFKTGYTVQSTLFDRISSRQGRRNHRLGFGLHLDTLFAPKL